MHCNKLIRHDLIPSLNPDIGYLTDTISRNYIDFKLNMKDHKRRTATITVYNMFYK